MSKERNTQIMRNDKCPPPKLKTYPYIELTEYALGSLSSITPKVFMVHDVCSCYMCKVGEIEYYELWNAYDKLCENGILGDENKIVAKKGLTNSLAFWKFFKVE